MCQINMLVTHFLKQLDTTSLRVRGIEYFLGGARMSNRDLGSALVFILRHSNTSNLAFYTLKTLACGV